MTNTPALDRLLDRPVAYHPIFVDLTGSVEAAVLLSQAVYWQRRNKSEDGTWYTSREEWYEQTRLGRYAQEQARAALRQHTWWHEERRGIPARLHYRVNLAGLIEAIAKLADGVPTSREDSTRECVRPQAGTLSTGQPADGAPANTEIPTDLSETTTTPRGGRGMSRRGRNVPNLPWPRTLTHAQVRACTAELAGCAQEHHTNLVRELTQRLTRRELGQVRLPHLWLRALVTAILDGTYLPSAPAESTEPIPSKKEIEERYQRLRKAAENQIDARLAKLVAERSGGG